MTSDVVILGGTAPAVLAALELAKVGLRVRLVCDEIVLPDHPVPLATGKHTRTPVPVAVYQPGVEPDDVETFDESAARRGTLGALKGSALMNLLLKVRS